MPKTKLYFAYGSNLNLPQMYERCPDARLIKTIKLNDWKLVFRCVADIIPTKGGAIYGAIFRITERCEEALDRYEGFPIMYKKRMIRIKINGKTERIMFYEMTKKAPESSPSRGYFSAVLDGFRDCNLPLKSLLSAVSIFDPNEFA